jgi:DNA-binding response OmpR family regulator
MAQPILLCIDDDPEALHVLKIGLEDRGYTVFTVGGAKEASAFLAATTPDLIITDLRMTPVNGFDLFVELRKSPALANVPVIFLTAVEHDFAQSYGKKLGVDAYMTKPIDLDRLHAVIGERLAART